MRIQSGSAQGPKVGLKDNDLVLEAISKQMLRFQEKLKRVEADQKLPPEEKTKQKNLISEQLNALRQQYTQREIAIAMEQRKAKPVSGEGTDVNGTDMSVLINADGALSRAKAGQSVKTSLESERRTLKGEIRQDEARGVDVTKKEQKVSALSASIQRILENMEAEKPRAYESKEDEQDALKNMRSEMNNRSGHVDMMV